MYLTQLIDSIKHICTLQNNVNSVIFQDKEIYNTSPTVEYGSILLYLDGATALQNTTLFNFSIYYIDRLTSDGSNMVDIWNVGTWMLPNILNNIKKTFDISTTNYLEYFKENFADVCGVVSISFSVEVDNETICPEYPCM